MKVLKISVSLFTDVHCQDLTPVKTEEFNLEGINVTLSYNISKPAAGSDYFFWYRQYAGKPPEFLIFISGLGQINKAETLSSQTNFSTKLSDDKKLVSLWISPVKLEDSALSYCAVRPTMTH